MRIEFSEDPAVIEILDATARGYGMSRDALLRQIVRKVAAQTLEEDEKYRTNRASEVEALAVLGELGGNHAK